jgi:hypothetical protein
LMVIFYFGFQLWRLRWLQRLKKRILKI